MADENELNELRERIGRLPTSDQCRLLELVLADHRRQREETLAWMLEGQAELVRREQQLRESGRLVPLPPEAKREAG